jgi:phosphotriesterase-related protein
MPVSSIAGKALTVLGPIDGKDLGVTLPHEHFTIDHVQANFSEPEDPADREMAYQPVSYDNLHWLRYHRTENKDNLRLPDEKKIIAEAMYFKRAGGGTVVDGTNQGINRDPKSLVRISKATGLNIIMGSGYYLGTSHPTDMDARTVEQIRDEIVRDVTVGVGSTGAKAGLIGEIACVWPIKDNEKKSLIAAARAQQLTGAPLNLHPGRKREGVFEAVEILKNAGADLSRTVVSHVDVRVRDHKGRVDLAKMGCFIEYDNIGFEGPRPVSLAWDPAIDIPTDEQRVREIMQLIANGFLKQIVISTDVCMKAHLRMYGGHGYDHIQKYFIPLMLRLGMTQAQVNTITIDNPRRFLCLA